MKKKIILGLMVIGGILIFLFVFNFTGSNKSSYKGPPSSNAPLPDALVLSLEKYVRKEMKRNNVAGLAMVLVHGNQVVYNQGFGVRDRETKEPVNTETLFGIGSSTKPMTAVVIASLVDAGVISWDTPVTEIFPAFALINSDYTNKVTIEHTLCMCTGVPRRMEQVSVQYEEMTAEDIIESLSEIQLKGRFGDSFNYSTRMISAGGYLAALATGSKYGELGQGYADLMQTQLLDPLGMSASTFSIDQAVSSENFATPYYTSLSEIHPIPPRIEGVFTPLAPGGGMWSNTEDLSKFLLMLLNNGSTPTGNQVLSSENLLYLWEQKVAIDPTIGYGLGWHVENYHGLMVYHHPGGTVGYSAELVVIPDLDVGFALLTNQVDLVAPIGRMTTYRLLEMLTGQEQVYDHQIRQTAKDVRMQILQLSLLTRKKVNSEEITPFLGNYYNEVLGDVTLVVHEDSTLWIDFGEYQTPIRPLIIEENQFIFFESIFIGKTISLDLDGDGNPSMKWTGDEAAYTFIKSKSP